MQFSARSQSYRIKYHASLIIMTLPYHARARSASFKSAGQVRLARRHRLQVTGISVSASPMEGYATTPQS